MRKIIVITMITIDGVMQAPGVRLLRYAQR